MRPTGAGFTTPVVLCVFNRPRHTREVMRKIAAVRPARFFVIADGPRAAHTGEADLCDEVREHIAALATWPTSISWNVAPNNLGNRKRIQSGLDWVFAEVEEAIILEDDCVPDLSFFSFCSTLLEHYRHESRVGTIAGSNYLTDGPAAPASYLFSRYPLVGGWATWRRTWRLYDRDLDGWPASRSSKWLDRILDDPLASLYWRLIFDQAQAGSDTWDYALTYSCWRAGFLSIHPRTNLVSNIGFGPEATHTLIRTNIADLPARPIEFRLAHPVDIVPAREHDTLLERSLYSGTREDLFRKARALIHRGRA
jgi:hypothetical protein